MNYMCDKINMTGMYAPTHSMMCPMMNQFMGTNYMQSGMGCSMNPMMGMCPMMMKAQQYDMPYVKIKVVKLREILD